jgi:hypothetical protein
MSPLSVIVLGNRKVSLCRRSHVPLFANRLCILSSGGVLQARLLRGGGRRSPARPGRAAPKRRISEAASFCCNPAARCQALLRPLLQRRIAGAPEGRASGRLPRTAGPAEKRAWESKIETHDARVVYVNFARSRSSMRWVFSRAPPKRRRRAWRAPSRGSERR